MNQDISYFARLNGRPPHRSFGIRQRERLSHFYAIGRTGTGKTNLLECLALQDMHRGRGICVIDPHGDLVLRLRGAVPEHRRCQLHYFEAGDLANEYRYNPLGKVVKERIPLAASGLLEAFKKLWKHEWGVRMEHVLRNTLFALLETDDASLQDVLKMLSDKTFRASVVAKLQNEPVRAFWEEEFARYLPMYRQQAIAPIQNKVGAFLADPRLHQVLQGGAKEIHLRSIMDQGEILLINLSKGILGDDAANLLGALLVTGIGLSALSRSDTAEAKRRTFFVYIDEFQSFTTLSVATMISEIRKYGIGLTLANQHLDQLEEAVRSAVLANVGTLVSFRIGPQDARIISAEFAPVFSQTDLVNLPNHSVYVKLMIDGAPSKPFSATTLLPSAAVL